MKTRLLCLLLSLTLLIPGAGAVEEGFAFQEGTALYLVLDRQPEGEEEALLQLLYGEFAAEGVILAPCCGVEGKAPAGAICLRRSEDVEPEHYAAEISAEQITVTAGDLRGLLYGGREILRRVMTGNADSLPCGSFSDGPDTAERGLMLDCARKYWSVPWLKNLIAQMSWLGYNTLQLHMGEDQGVRFDIWSEGADSNGNDFSFLIGYDSNWNTDYPDPKGGCFYTAAELRELVEYAKYYQIDIIPDYDMPPHCDVLTARYESYVAEHTDFTFQYGGVTYSAEGITADGVTTPYNTDIYPNADFFSIRVDSTPATVDVTNPVGRAFLLAVAQAYGEFFRALGCESFHFGFDELNISPSDGWDDYARDHIDGGSTAVDTAIDFANEVTALLKGLGYTSVRAFNDVLYDEDGTIALDEDIALYVWSLDSAEEVEPYLDDGRTLFNCLQNYCYYALRVNDKANGGDARDPENTWWSFHHATEERIFYEWNPGRMYNHDAEGKTVTEQLGGGYFLVWGDFGGWRTEEEVWNGDDGGQYNLIDRLWSNSAKMWDWDLNEELSFEKFCEKRDSVRLFPGFSQCSQAPALTQSQTVCIPAADHEPLRRLLEKTGCAREEAVFTAESFSAFRQAYAAAEELEADPFADEAQISGAVESLTAAAENLTYVSGELVIPATWEGQKVSALFGRRFFGKLFFLTLPDFEGYSVQDLRGGVLLPGGCVLGLAGEETEIILCSDCQ